MVFQLKQRTISKLNVSDDQKWFRKKVLGQATKQIRDTVGYFISHPTIEIKNQKGHSFELQKLSAKRLIKVILYALPSTSVDRSGFGKFHVSSTAGFIHIVEASDYVEICKVLATPAEIFEYFIFREFLSSSWTKSIQSVSEIALIGQFLSGSIMHEPREEFKTNFRSYVDTSDEFDLFFLLNDLGDRIQSQIGQNSNERSHYDILSEFAQLDRGALKQAKLRIKACIDAIKEDKSLQPYRMLVPRTKCGFLFTAVPSIFVKDRIQLLSNMSDLSKYDFKCKKHIGISFSLNGSVVTIDWSYLNFEWQKNELDDKFLRQTNPFRQTEAHFLTRYNPSALKNTSQ